MGFLSFNNKLKIRIAWEFFVGLSGFIFMAFVAIYFAAYFGAKIAGLLLIVYAIIGIVFSLISGYYVDRIGRKKLLIIAEIVKTLAITVLIIANSPAFTLPVLSAVMFMVLRAATGIDKPASEAMLIDISTTEERKAVYTTLYWIRNLIMAMGAVIAGLTFKHYLFELLIGLGILSVISTIMVAFFMEETLRKKVTEKENVFAGLLKNYKVVIRDKLYIVFSVAFMLIVVMEVQLSYYIAVRLSKMSEQPLFSFQVSGTEIYGFLNSGNAIMVVAFSLIMGRWLVKLNGKKPLITALFLNILGYAILSYATNVWVLFLFMAVVVIGETVYAPIVQDFMSNLPKEDKIGSYMAFQDLIFYFALIIGSFYVTLGGFFGNLTMTVIIFVTGMIGLVMFYILMPNLTARKDAAIKAGAKKEAAL